MANAITWSRPRVDPPRATPARDSAHPSIGRVPARIRPQTRGSEKAIDKSKRSLLPDRVKNPPPRLLRSMAIALSLASPLAAATLYVDEDATGANDGSSWTDAYTLLRVALANATSGDQIWVAEGTYHPDVAAGPASDDRSDSFELENGVELYGGFAGGETTIGQRNLFLNPTVLSGEIQQDGDRTNNSYHVVDGSGTDSTAILNGFVIRDGHANGTGNDSSGAGFVCRTVVTPETDGPALLNCRFISNHADGGGGGAWVSLHYASFTNCSFSGNRAAYGGAIYLNDADPDFINCTVQGNTAESFGSGGGVYMVDSEPEFTNSLFWGNLTADLEVSWIDLSGAGNTPSWDYCLVQGQSDADLDAYGANNFDGENPANDPRFLSPVDPLDAPTPGGDLSLTPASTVAIDAGQNAANTTLGDVASRTRKLDGDGDTSAVIDLGAHEFLAPIHVDDDATGADDGSSWSDAFADLQDALDVAQPGDEIWVAEGFYQPSEEFDPGVVRSTSFTIPDATRVRGGFDATEEHPDERDVAAHVSELNGNFGGPVSVLDDAFHVVRLIGVGSLTELDGFTVTRGSANGAAPYQRGGGLRVEGGAPRVLNCTFSDNFATQGAGAHVQGGSAARFVDCRFRNNEATSAGGGFSCISSATVRLNRCRFAGNIATNGGGAACSGSAPVFANSIFLSNEADYGAGAYQTNGADAEFLNVTFHDNRAAIDGGGARNEDSDPSFANVIIWENMAQSSTTALGVSVSNDNSTPTYSHCLVQNRDLSSSGGNLDGTNPASDPRFRQPQDDSGQVLDLRLLPDSPVIDAGDNTALDADLDHEEAPRVADGDLDTTATIDLGAYEFRTPVFVDGSAAGGGDGTSWTDAFVALDTAIDATTAGDTLWIAEGTYQPSGVGGRDDTIEFAPGVHVYGGFPAGGGDFAARDASTHGVVITAEQGATVATHRYHAAVASGLDRTARLDGLTFTGGNAAGLPSFLQNAGGGLLLDDCSLTVHDCRFVDNLADQGGGLAIPDGAPRIVSCAFEANGATEGGGLHLGNCDAVILNCRFAGNEADTGGGIHGATTSGARLVNPVISGNHATDFGGGLHLVGSDLEIVNATVSGNNAGTDGGGLGLDQSSAPVFHNSIFWNNRAAGGTGSESASLFRLSQPTGSSLVEFHFSLVEGFTNAELVAIDSDSADNLDGELAGNDPDFLTPVDPATAPATSGDLRLRTGSPAIDAGDNGANDSETDAAGSPRIDFSTIDLGAYEGGFSGADFASLFPSLTESGDDNGNGFSNYLDYATGADPTAPHDSAGYPTFTENDLAFGARDGVVDANWTVRASETLEGGSWDPLSQGTDYTIKSQTSAGGRILYVLEIIPPVNPPDRRFFRLEFSND